MTHPIFPPPIPFHPTPYAGRLAAKLGLLFELKQAAHRYPPNSRYKKKLLKFLSTPIFIENLAALQYHLTASQDQRTSQTGVPVS